MDEGDGELSEPMVYRPRFEQGGGYPAAPDPHCTHENLMETGECLVHFIIVRQPQQSLCPTRSPYRTVRLDQHLQGVNGCRIPGPGEAGIAPFLVEAVEAGLLAGWNDQDLYGRSVNARLLEERIEVISCPRVGEVDDHRAELTPVTECCGPAWVCNEDSGLIIYGR